MRRRTIFAWFLLCLVAAAMGFWLPSPAVVMLAPGVAILVITLWDDVFFPRWPR